MDYKIQNQYLKCYNHTYFTQNKRSSCAMRCKPIFLVHDSFHIFGSWITTSMSSSTASSMTSANALLKTSSLHIPTTKNQPWKYPLNLNKRYWKSTVSTLENRGILFLSIHKALVELKLLYNRFEPLLLVNIFIFKHNQSMNMNMIKLRPKFLNMNTKMLQYSYSYLSASPIYVKMIITCFTCVLEDVSAIRHALFKSLVYTRFK